MAFIGKLTGLLETSISKVTTWADPLYQDLMTTAYFADISDVSDSDISETSDISDYSLVEDAGYITFSGFPDDDANGTYWMSAINTNATGSLQAGYNTLHFPTLVNANGWYMTPQVIGNYIQPVYQLYDDTDALYATSDSYNMTSSYNDYLVIPFAATSWLDWTSNRGDWADTLTVTTSTDCQLDTSVTYGGITVTLISPIVAYSSGSSYTQYNGYWAWAVVVSHYVQFLYLVKIRDDDGTIAIDALCRWYFETIGYHNDGWVSLTDLSGGGATTYTRELTTDQLGVETYTLPPTTWDNTDGDEPDTWEVYTYPVSLDSWDGSGYMTVSGFTDTDANGLYWMEALKMANLLIGSDELYGDVASICQAPILVNANGYRITPYFRDDYIAGVYSVSIRYTLSTSLGVTVDTTDWTTMSTGSLAFPSITLKTPRQTADWWSDVLTITDVDCSTLEPITNLPFGQVISPIVVQSEASAYTEFNGYWYWVESTFIRTSYKLVKASIIDGVITATEIVDFWDNPSYGYSASYDVVLQSTDVAQTYTKTAGLSAGGSAVTYTLPPATWDNTDGDEPTWLEGDDLITW